MATQPNPSERNMKFTGDGQSVNRNATGETVLRPAVDIFETADGITLQADLPGVSKERLNVRIEGTTLLVEGTLGIDAGQEMVPLHADIRSRLYRRSFVLSNELETARIDANLRDGLLTVCIPKRAELRPRRIEVQT